MGESAKIYRAYVKTADGYYLVEIQPAEAEGGYWIDLPITMPEPALSIWMVDEDGNLLFGGTTGLGDD